MRKEGVKMTSSYCQIYSTVVAGGRVFLQFFDWVMEIRDNNIFKVCRIPNLPMDHWSCFYGKLFSLDNILYMCNCKQIFKLIND